MHSSLKLFTSLFFRTALGCVFGRGNGLSWLISVCFTTKVSLCGMLSESSVGSECPVVLITFDLPRELYKLQVCLSSQFLFVLYLFF